MEPVAAGQKIAGELVRLPILAKRDAGLVGIDVAHRDAVDVEQEIPAGVEPRRDQVLDDFVLCVDGNRAPARQLRKVDPVTPPAEAELDAVVDEALALHPLADAGLGEKVDGALFEHAGPNRALDLVPAADFEHDRLDALQMKQMRQQQASGAGADDPDTRPHLHRWLPIP
jgi:hypothetical protein